MVLRYPMKKSCSLESDVMMQGKYSLDSSVSIKCCSPPRSVCEKGSYCHRASASIIILRRSSGHTLSYSRSSSVIKSGHSSSSAPLFSMRALISSTEILRTEAAKYPAGYAPLLKNTWSCHTSSVECMKLLVCMVPKGICSAPCRKSKIGLSCDIHIMAKTTE